MAQFSFKGLDEVRLTLKEIAEIPEEVQDEMLSAQADVVVEAQKEKAIAYGVVDTGLMVRSIKKGRPKTVKGTRVLYVTPHGTRTRGKGKKTTNAEIAFVNEFGGRNQKARPFMRAANESCAEATTQAGFAVYDRWLQTKDL